MTRTLTTARVAGGVTGACCLALGLLTVTGPTVPDERWGSRGSLINALGLIAFVAMTLALELLPPLLALRRPGRGGQRVAQAGLGLMVLESIASQVHGGNTLGPIFFAGLVLTLGGLLLVAVDGLRRRRWLAPVPFLALLVGIGSGDLGGFMILGLAWVALALAGHPSPGPNTQQHTITRDAQS